MKKQLLVSLSLAALSLSYSASANVTNITQVGENTAVNYQDCVGACDNQATIVQTNTDGSKISHTIVNQYTDKDRAYVTQENTDNGWVNVDQRNGSKATATQKMTKNSWVSINQDRDPTTGELADGRNEAKVHQQDGEGNSILIKQLGSDGQAFFIQNGGSGNQAKLIQNKGSKKELAYAWQTGNGNWLDVVQNGQGDKTSIIQRGDRNLADIDVATTSRNSTTGTSQLGDDNSTKIYTQGIGNLASVAQTGDRNCAEANLLGNRQSAMISQLGDENNAKIGLFETATATKVDIKQNGFKNQAFADSSCPFSQINISQTGNKGYALVNQSKH